MDSNEDENKKIVRTQEIDLGPVSLEPLGLRKSLDYLLDGEVLLVRGIEQTRGKDVLVRLDDRRVPVTQISYDIQPADGYWRDSYWVVFDLPLNAFSTYPCYLYRNTEQGSLPKFFIGDNVYYTSKQEGTKTEDTGVITEVYKDKASDPRNPQWYYSVTRDSEIYPEEELTKDPLK